MEQRHDIMPPVPFMGIYRTLCECGKQFGPGTQEKVERAAYEHIMEQLARANPNISTA